MINSSQQRTIVAVDSSARYSSVYSPSIVMQCEKLLSLVLNRTAPLNDQQRLPSYIRELLAKRNLSLRLPKTIDDCAVELTRLVSNTDELNLHLADGRQTYAIQDHSRSLIVFVILIGFVSLISMLGNLCLAKVLYSKRYRLTQTDRIVLCLALSKSNERLAANAHRSCLA
jgi:hypothetical protein